MKLHLKFLCILFISLFCISYSYSLDNSLKGIELCDSIYSSLKKSGFTPSTQSLVTAGENSFPYNIIENLEGNDKSRDTLVLVFFQEDIAAYSGLIKDIIKELSAKDYDFNITILFAYGEEQKIQKANMIYGTQVFIESINTNQNYTGIIFDFDSDFYGIQTSSAGLTSPSWLIQNSCNTLAELGLGNKLPAFFLSQISSYKFNKIKTLSTFFENEIPAIILKLQDSELNQDSAKQIILESVSKYASTKNQNWNRHFMMLRLFGRYYTLSESAILRISIPVIFIWILFVFMLVFINTRQKRRAWSTVKNIWYCVPVIYLLVVISFFLMRLWFNTVLSNVSDAAKIYGILTAQIIGALFISELFFILILSLNNKFEVKSIDYLLVFSCFINQSVFILIEISLCPIFIFFCFLSLVALSTKNNLLHIIIFLMMILTIVPYGNAVIKNSDIELLRRFISTNNNMVFIVSLALYPCFIILLRILTSIRSHKKSFAAIIAGTSISFVIISFGLITTSMIRSKQINKNQKQPLNIEISNGHKDLINIAYSDKNIFDDIIRTLDITLNTDCVICDVQINTQNQNPILYTDNDYTSNSENSIRFSIPDYPPSHMTFSYGATPVPCRIIVSAVIEDSKDKYTFITKNLLIGDME